MIPPHLHKACIKLSVARKKSFRPHCAITGLERRPTPSRTLLVAANTVARSKFTKDLH